MEQLIKEIEKQGSHGAVLFKLDSENRVTHISPLVRGETAQEMYNQLSDVRDAIHRFLEELINKGLCKS